MSPKGAKKRVFVAMSGGVDSSVAALLLKRDGYEVTGVFIRSYNLDGCSERDAEDARRVAEHLEIPFYVFDFKEEYKRDVMDYMIHGYRRGITPNPDVMCNKRIKFGLFLEKALALGANFIATGHYVRLAFRFASRGTGRSLAPAASAALGLSPRRLRRAVAVGDQARRGSEAFRSKQNGKLINFSLLEAKDKNKDQSYFLWTLTQEQLKNCLFPIGDYLKSEVREIARKAGLPTAEKKDSQGICFLGKVSLADFLKSYIPERRGEVLDVRGQKIGEHSGAEFYTIGQRHLGIKNYESRIKGRHKTPPAYVMEKNVKENRIVVAEGSKNPALYKKEIQLESVNFIKPITNYKSPIVVYARVRYRQPLATAKLYKLQAKSYKLIFEQPQKFVAPGQSAVFYRKNSELLGGGVIV